MRFFLSILVLGLCAVVLGTQVGGADSKPAPEILRVLYLYGSVAADGTIPAPEGRAFHQMRLNDDGALGMSQFQAAVENHEHPLMRAAGVRFRMEEAYDAVTELTPELLGRYRVLILGSNNRVFSDAERKAVGEWVNGGGGLVAWSDSAFGGDYRSVGVGNPVGRDSNNSLTVQFGMFFMRDNGAGNYAIRHWEREHYLNRMKKQDGLVFRGEGVSVVRVSGKAVMLARLQNGGLNGRVRLHRLDERDEAVGRLRPDTDAAVAVARIGQGRGVGTFDRNTFWNAGAGTRLSHENNREYAQRLMIWAAGKDSGGGGDPKTD